jgi:T5SS/PEP-CTERM-associated repeat protein
MAIRLICRLGGGLTALASLALWGATAYADNCRWSPPGGVNGNFSDASNWSDSFSGSRHVPGSGDVAVFDNGGFQGAPVVTFNSAPLGFPQPVYTTDGLEVKDGRDVTFTRGGFGIIPLYKALSFITVPHGKLTTTIPISALTTTLNGSSNAPSELDVTGFTFTVTSTSASQAALAVGNTGTGTAKITGGSKLELTGASGNVSIGAQFGSSGEIDVDGAGSKLALDGNASTMTVGDDGSAFINITNGGVVEDNAALVGTHSSGGGFGAGFVTVDGASSLWTNRDHLAIGTSTVGIVPLSGLTLANGGTTTVAGQFLLGTHGIIRGSGFITAGSLVSSGLISPGAEAGSFHQASALHITASAAQLSSGALHIQLAGTGAGTTYDQVLFTGTTTIGCELDVALANSFVPLLGNSFHILDLGTSTGTFSAITLPALSTGLAWNTSQLYSNGVLTVSSAGVPGDYNDNGTVDAADYILWRKGVPLANEVDTPGTVNGNDYAAWRARFGNTGGAGAGVSANTAIPEPTSLVLMMFAPAGWCLRRRQAA